MANLCSFVRFSSNRWRGRVGEFEARAKDTLALMNSIAFPLRVGRALRRRRAILNITQEKLSADLGMDRAYYACIERGQKNMRMDTLERVCLALGSQPWEILKDT
jgi:DNA-binding Xre family transcriptional regulator